MSQVNNIELIQKKFTKSTLDELVVSDKYSQDLFDFPIVYLLFNKSKHNQIYIGETSNARSRLSTHLKDSEKRKFEDFYLIFHPMFNKSATYNIETNLIQYLGADSSPLKTINKTQNVQKQTHNYYYKDFFHNELFNHIWERLRTEGIAVDSVENIRNRDVYKISPFTLLNDEQLDVKEKIVEFCKVNINKDDRSILIINGEAGTGKSVLLSSTFKHLQDEAKTASSRLFSHDNNYLLVNHGEMLKTYQTIAKKVSNLLVKNFQKPTPFINQVTKGKIKNADIVLVDEAHLLLSKSDPFNYFKSDNHLEEIVKSSKITILIFDTKQVLKAKSYWDEKSLYRLVDGYRHEEFKLTHQMRMGASIESQTWINNFVDKKLTQIPRDSNFEIEVFESAAMMYDKIKQRNKAYGLSRVVSTFDYLHNKDGSVYYVEEGDFKLPWNGKHERTWAEEPSTINEVGSIYTIQGFDLNYVGVILGPSVIFDTESQTLKIDPSKYRDSEAFKGVNDLTDCDGSKIDSALVKEQIILNSINVLFKRGVKGLYIYASNEELRNALLALKRK